MNTNYSHLKAMLAITRASFRSLLRSPSAIVFSVLFPLIFILVFGFIGGGGRVTFKVGFNPKSDTSSMLYRVLRDSVGLTLVNKPLAEMEADLERGKMTAILNIREQQQPGPRYVIDMKTSGASNVQNVKVLQSIINTVILRFNQILYPQQPSVAVLIMEEKLPGRVYKTIDFILPGQLGFSLLSAGVFGVAFIFFSLRQNLVLKRFFATPIKKGYIVFGEALSRVIFQMLTAVIILVLGHYFFGFTLVNGFVTMIEMLVLSLIGLLVFMGFGFIVSGMAKNEAAIPPFSNLITLPQFLLAGTFFPVDNFPKWLQPISKILPLTHLNTAMRNVAFDGAHLTDCGTELAVLLAWGVVAYAVAVRVFKWE
jgi:ABC-2 type transport system permease protein